MALPDTKEHARILAKIRDVAHYAALRESKNADPVEYERAGAELRPDIWPAQPSLIDGAE